MTATLLIDDATTEAADLDLDVRLAAVDTSGDAFASDDSYTSPSTYGVQSRCPLCC